MKQLPIADCRLLIAKSLSRRSFARGDHDSGECVGFVEQRRQLLCRHGAGFDEQFQPQRSFVGFLLNGSNFGNEFSLTAGAATGAVICRHRGAAADDLFGDGASGVVRFGNGARQFDDSQCEGFCAGFEFGRIHGANLQTQSATGNWQSAITR